MYRFIDLNQLEHVLDTKSFLLKLPSTWKDKYEGFPYAKLDCEEGKRKVQTYFARHGIGFNEDIIRILKTTVYCLCFTKCRESSAHWDAYYSHSDVVRIQVNKPNFCKEFCDGRFGVLKSVKYVVDTESEKFLMKTLKEIVLVKSARTVQTKPARGYLFKRARQFRWEEEVRYLLYDPLNLTIPDPASNQFVFNTNPSLNRTKLKEAISRGWRCENNELVTSVLVHPDASDVFCERVEKICENHEISFLGKSKMNDAP
ncbi:MAG: hypothetical protein D3910_10940 [Candidatus Electrothrix sp. ATG2]|nr:hypothetical protein [Candidatus Electrothrix sp. ATG2]